MFNRFASGKKVYGQGSYAPTKGQVNPQGYIQREVKRRNQQALSQRGGVSKVGNDGQSDTRSGLAKNIMGSRHQPAGAGRPPRAVVRSLGGGNSYDGTRKSPLNSPSNPTNPSGTPVSTGTPVAPTVTINPTGQLQLPYGSEFANQALDAQMSYDAELLALQEEEQNNESSYASNTRDLEQGYEQQQDNTRNTNAAAGTAFSSAYGTGVNEDARLYNNSKNDLLTGYTNFKTSLGNRKNQATTAFNTMLQRAQQGYADQLAQNASTQASVDADAQRAAEQAAHEQQVINYNIMQAAHLQQQQQAANAANDIQNTGWGSIANWDGGGNGGNRPPRPSPQHVWRDGKWKKP